TSPPLMPSFFLSSRGRHTRSKRDWSFRRVLFRSHDSDAANDVNLDHVDHGCLEKLCPQQLLIISQTVKGPLAHRVADAFHIKEAHDDYTDDRVQEHDEEEEQRRS